jgi:hypothetical protein
MLHSKIVHCSFVLVFILLTGCAAIPQSNEKVAIGIDGIACVGKVEHPPEGLVAVDENLVLQTALGASGQGKLCDGQVFQVTQPVTVYRVWNSDKSYTVYGKWWSFDLPEGPKQKYRKDNGICPSWSTLNRMSSCSIKIGSIIVIGPGQSAKCEQMTYAKSAVNQVFIPNDSRNNVLHVENCSVGIDWP